MIIISKDSYATQVFKYLQHEIETGRLPPLSKLQGIRSLSKQFGVSQNVVLSALKELEKRRLIYRVERKGIFVSETASNPEMLEVLMLIFMSNPTRDAFTSRMMSLISSRSAAGKLHFYVRIVTFDENKFYSRERQIHLLEAEIAKLSSTFHSDCAVVIGSRFRKADIKIALRLPFPTLFIGNFHEGDYPDLQYNRVGFRNDYMEHRLQYAKERQFTNLVLIESFDGKSSDSYVETRNQFCKDAQQSGINVRVFTLPDARHPDQERRRDGIRKTVHEIAVKLPKRCLYIFECVIDRPFVTAELSNAGVQFESGKCELFITPFEYMDITAPWAHYENISEESKEKVNEHVVFLLHELAENKITNFIEDISVKHTLVE